MTSKNSMELIKAVLQRIECSKGYDTILNKVRVTSAGSGKCCAEFTVGPEHLNSGESLHGGCSATLVDCISTLAVMTSEQQLPGVSVDMHIRYLKAAFEGDEILIEADTLKAGKHLAYLTVTMKNKRNGQLLVEGSHTKFLSA